jgi:beta-phosphoglucomutase-like phosphatase (HAD superfamily)
VATGVLPAAAPTLDGLVTGWRTALRAARSALESAESLPADERHDRARRLASEVAPTQDLLRALGRDLHSKSPVLPLVVSPLEARRLLGLPQEIAACVFNLDGVLIASAAIHIAAWADVFDDFLATRAERTGGLFAPFNPRVDYLEHVHARPRADGVRAFLAGRGIRLPEGTATDSPAAETVHGLANAKNAALRHRLDVQGVYAFDGSRSYLELAHEAGVRCAVISASANTQTILERAGLAVFVDGRVDGTTIAREHLQVKPAPDMLLAACRLLGVEPAHAAAFETTRAGVEAGRNAGFDVVIGVDGATGADRRESLRDAGADVVVSGVGDMIEQRLAA